MAGKDRSWMKRRTLSCLPRLGRVTQRIYDRRITILQEPREDEGIFFLMDRKRRIDLIVVIKVSSIESAKKARKSFDGVCALLPSGG